MLTDQATGFRRWGLAGATLAMSALLGCPGKLSDKASFIAYTPAETADGGSAGALSEPGGGAGAIAGAGAEAGAAGTTNLGPCGDVPARIFVPSCGGTGCHGATASQQGLDLVSPGVASRVVGVTAKVCASILANPADPGHSLLYTKLSPNPGCGAQMPLARPPLSDDDAACILAWIAEQ